MELFAPNGWGLVCRLSRVFLTYVLIYQQIFLGVVWANGDLIRVEITQDNAFQTQGSLERLPEENLPLKLKVTRQRSDSTEQKATQEIESILYERRLHFKKGINEDKKLSSTSSLRLTSTHTDGALNLLFKERGLNLRFLIRSTGEISIEKLIAEDAIELCTVGRITTSLSPIKATSLSLVGQDILNYTSLCTTKELALTAVGTQARKGLITNMPEGRIKSQGLLNVFKGDFHNQGSLEAVDKLEADFHQNNLFNRSQEKGYSLIQGKSSFSLRNIDRFENTSEIKSQRSLFIESNILENLKTISSDRKLKIHTIDSLYNLQGTIQASDRLSINVVGEFYNQANIFSDKKIKLSVGEHFENTSLGHISASSLSLTCMGLGQNKGQLASQSLNITAATFENYHQIETQEGELNELSYGEGFHLYEDSFLSANQHLNIRAKSLIIDQGALIETGQLDAILFYLANSGHIISQEIQDLKIGRFYNEGKLRASSLILTVFDTFENVSDDVEGTKTLTFGVKTLLNYGQLKSKLIKGRIAHLNNEGTIQADETFDASIQKLENQGLILSAGDIWVNELSDSSTNSGLIQAQSIHLSSQQEHLSQFQGNFTPSSPQAYFLNRGSILADNKTSFLLSSFENHGTMQASEEIWKLVELKNEGSIKGGDLLSLHVMSLLINNGTITSNQEISIVSDGSCTNTNTISASKALTLNFKNSFSNLGMIYSPLLTLQGRILRNKGQIIGKQALDLQTQSFINDKEGRLKGEEVNINSHKSGKNIGLIKAKKTLRVKGLNFINRLSGQLYSQGTFLGRYKGKLINKGKIKAFEQIDLDSFELENDGAIKSEGTVKLTADKLESSGRLEGDEAVILKVNEKGDLKDGSIVTQGRLTVSGGTIKVSEGVSLESLAIYLLLQHFENYGTIDAQKEVHHKGGTLLNHGSIKVGESIIYEGTLSLINNGIMDTNSLKLLGVRKLYNTHQIIAHQALEGQIDTLQNRGLLQGKTLALTNLNTLFLNEEQGKVLGIDTFEVSGQGKVENNGTIETHRGSLTLKPQILSNHGNINATNHSLIIEAPKVDNAGQLLGENITLSSQDFQNSKEGKVVSRQGKAEFVCRQTLRNAGLLQAPGTISLTALNTINEGQVLSLVRILIATNTLTNKGLLQANKIEWAKRLISFLNHGNVISASPFTLEAASFTNQGTIKGENLAFTLLEGQNSGLLLASLITLIFQNKFSNAAEGKIITDKVFEVSGEGEFENFGHIGEATLKNAEATEVHPGGQLTFITKSFSNHGSINSGNNNLNLDTEILTNAGHVKGNLAFKKSIATFVNEAAGQISSLTPFILESISFMNRGLLSAPSLTLILTSAQNEGTLYGQTFLKLVFKELFSQSGKGKIVDSEV
ncbi:MAG: hypothetical protein BGO77_06245 [Caedibacter sp. 37-49]|mgnify:CR=1 FL=1|nr:MAG: hypothetical protein BGO77_06245 [Caedibacter sp. 37-49]